MNGSIIWPPKTPAEVVDRGLDWIDRLQPGEYLVSSVWETPDEITIGASGLDEEYPKTTVIWLSGGVDKRTYRFLNRVGTSEGRLMEMSVILPVKAFFPPKP